MTVTDDAAASARVRHLGERLWARVQAFAGTRAADPVLLVVLVVLSTLMRLRGIHFRYWIDEAISIGIASHPLSQLHGLLKQDGSPPLWYACLHVWMSIFGNGEVSTHTMSLICAQLCIPAAWWAARPMGRRVAVFAAILVAGAPYLSSYGEETRMYAMMALWSVLLIGATLRVFVYRRRRWLPVFVFALDAAMYTHNWGLFLAVACFVAIVACVWAAAADERRGLIRDGLIGLVAAFIIYIPWLPTMLYQARYTGAPWAARTTLWTWAQGLYFIVGGRDAAVAILLGGIGGLITAYRLAPPKGVFRREVWVVVALTWVTFGAGWLLGKAHPSWAPRYEGAIIGPLALVAAIALAKGRRLAIFATFLVCLWWAIDPRTAELWSKSNVKAVADQTNHLFNSQSVMLVTQPEEVPDVHYYMPEIKHFGTPVGVPQRDYAVDWVNMLPRMEAHYNHNSVLPAELASVPAGATVGLMVPYSLAKGTRYLDLIMDYTGEWVHTLKTDKQFTPVVFTKKMWKGSGNPVELYVFRKK